MVVYDKLKWHEGGRPERGRGWWTRGLHLVLFTEWLVRRGLHRYDESQPHVRQLLAGRIDGRKFLHETSDGVLADIDLNETGNAFASRYYVEADGNLGLYLEDFLRLARSLETLDAKAGPRELWLLLKPQLDARFAEWNRGELPRLPAERMAWFTMPTAPEPRLLEPLGVGVWNLRPEDRFVATWLDLDPLPLPPQRPFDVATGVALLKESKLLYRNTVELDALKLPSPLSKREARFWLGYARTSGLSARDRLETLRKLDVDSPATNEEITDWLATCVRSETSADILHALAGPEALFAICGEDAYHSNGTFMLNGPLVRGFNRRVYPWLSRADREALGGLLQPTLVRACGNGASGAFRELALAGRFGFHAPLHLWFLQLVKEEFGFESSTNQILREAIFGLRGVDTIVHWMKELEFRLDCVSDVRAWLTLTGDTELEWLKASIAEQPSHELQRAMAAEAEAIMGAPPAG